MTIDFQHFDSHIEWQIDRQQHSASYTIAEQAEITPHLILHFDVNRTLIFSDVVQNQSPEDVIVNGLADRLEYLWDETLTHPINYTNYVKYHLYPNPERSKEIKQKQKSQTTRFLEFLRESNHPLYPAAQQLFERAQQALAKQKTLVFPSFYNLLAHLKGKNIAYTLVFRTFGSDIRDIAEELNQQLGPDFLTHFYSFSQGVFNFEYASPADFYRYIKNAGYHMAIQDDWNWWFKHSENYQFGKPFPIDSDDAEICSLFFDDNATLNRDHPENNIVAPFDIAGQRELTPEELVAQKRLFPVDTLEALCNENYFIDLIEQISHSR